MKNKSVQFFAAFLASAFFLLASSQGFAQNKGTIVQTKPTGSDISVTKIFEFQKGGLSISPLAGDVSYTIYERTSSTSNWAKTDEGTITVKDGKTLEVCIKTAERVKVEIKGKCDRCVEVKEIKCDN